MRQDIVRSICWREAGEEEREVRRGGGQRCGRASSESVVGLEKRREERSTCVQEMVSGEAG